MAAKTPSDDRMRLFDAVLSGQANEATLRQLESLLDEDPNARQQLADLSQLDVDLRFVFRTGALEPQSYTTTAAASTNREPVRPSGSLEDKTKRRTWQAWMMLAAAIALVVASVEVLQHHKPSEPVTPATTSLASKPPAPVATLTSLHEVVWDSPPVAIGGTILEGGTFKIARGEAHISVGYGAEIAVEGPCSLTFDEVDRVMLDYGTVAVHVAEWATGYTVITDTMKVVDLGTTFTVSSQKGEGAQTAVLKGLVRVHPKVTDEAKPQGVLVSEGGTFGVDKLGRPEAYVKATTQLAELAKLDDLRPYKPVALCNTGVGFDVGDEDPNWRIVAGPASDIEHSIYAVVCTPDERYLANVRDVSQWVSMPNWRNAARNSLYTFQTTFDLTGYDVSTIRLFGRFLADNGIQGVRVNGQPVKVESWIDNDSYQEFDHNQFRFVNVTYGLVAGENVIEIDVWNGVFKEPSDRQQDPNPMALRVEWYAFGRQTSF